MTKQEKKIYDKNHQRKQRDAALEALGGRCVQCGNTDRRVLQIDHVNGGGAKHLKTVSWRKRYPAIVKDQTGFQLLCANCNWIKRAECDENDNWPHEPKIVTFQARV